MKTAQFSAIEVARQRLTVKPETTVTVKEPKESDPKLDLNDPEFLKCTSPNDPIWGKLYSRETMKLFYANCSAKKVTGCHVYNDWHKQGLAVKEIRELREEYNKQANYVSKPKGAKGDKPARLKRGKEQSAVDIGAIVQAELAKYLSALNVPK